MKQGPSFYGGGAREDGRILDWKREAHVNVGINSLKN